ncbi:hypothetical protein FA15DRAFT_342085 [Coprinopsis marcescibilis]|uniref:Uncharacterized protein n=1 Tax=Coprinopsis marcescibilis TaxID=230819 RepID=A0A5C3KBS1_COPMA|nr:hypothetical protein FA15DRAFT_342085 [Coprinopsis marcescibilis]
MSPYQPSHPSLLPLLASATRYAAPPTHPLSSCLHSPQCLPSACPTQILYHFTLTTSFMSFSYHFTTSFPFHTLVFGFVLLVTAFARCVTIYLVPISITFKFRVFCMCTFESPSNYR